MKLFAILILAAAGFAFPLSAEVFSLWPFSSGEGGGDLDDALKPAKLCGIVSEGMILCAENDRGELSLLAPERDMEDGCEIF